MKLLKTSGEIRDEISRCIEEYSNISFAVAWIKDNDICKQLLKNKNKISISTFGIDFFGTDAEVLQNFKGSNKVKIYKGAATFHPKIYLFYNIKRYTAIIGSANLTEGGMHNNDECAVLLTNDDNSKRKLFSEIIKQLETYFYKARVITNSIVETYKQKYGNIKKYTQELDNSMEYVEQIIEEAPCKNLSWEDVSKGITEDVNDFKSKIKILSEIGKIIKQLKQELFSTIDKSDDFKKNNWFYSRI